MAAMSPEEHQLRTEHGERLKRERLRLDLTHEELASATGVSRATQFAYENGSRSADTVYLARAREAGVDVHFVLTGHRERTTAGITEMERALLDRYNALSGPLRKTVDDVLALASKAAIPDSAAKIEQVFHGTVGAVGDAARVRQSIKTRSGR